MEKVEIIPSTALIHFKQFCFGIKIVFFVNEISIIQYVTHHEPKLIVKKY